MYRGVSQQYFNTGRGRRYKDQLAENIAHESKVGYTCLSSPIKESILKDVWFLKNEIDDFVWHFFRSEVTGKRGASKNLLNFLEKNETKYITLCMIENH